MIEKTKPITDHILSLVKNSESGNQYLHLYLRLFSSVSKFIQAVLKTIQILSPSTKVIFDIPYFKKHLIKLGMLEVSHIDHRIDKIHTARENLIDALEAINDLQAHTNIQKAEYDKLRQAIKHASSEKAGIEASAEELSQIESMRIETIRKAFNIPTEKQIRRGYLISFCGGLILALLGSFTYDFAFKPLFLYIFPSFQ